MSKTFAEMRKSRKNSVQALQEKIDKEKSGYTVDERYWTPTRDKAGNAKAIIRFLPCGPGEDDNWVRLFSHFVKGTTGKYYVENSLTTLGKEDPVSEHNSYLWNVVKDEKTASIRKRKLNYISNILVVKDFQNPDNDGKIFLYSYGAQVFDKIKSALAPEIEGEEACDVFDMWEGKNLTLVVKSKKLNKNLVPNYESSYFVEEVSTVSDDDDEIKEIWESKLYQLKPEVAEDKFKTYEELARSYSNVIGVDVLAQIGKKSGDASLSATTSSTSQKTKDRFAEVDEDDNASEDDLNEDTVPWTEDDDDLPKVDDSDDDDDDFDAMLSKLNDDD